MEESQYVGRLDSCVGGNNYIIRSVYRFPGSAQRKTTRTVHPQLRKEIPLVFIPSAEDSSFDLDLRAIRWVNLV